MLLTFITLGALSGYILRRVGSGRRLRPWERKVLRPLGWVLMAVWLGLASALFATVLWALMS